MKRVLDRFTRVLVVLMVVSTLINTAYTRHAGKYGATRNNEIIVVIAVTIGLLHTLWRRLHHTS